MKVQPFTDAELLEFGPNLGTYLTTLTLKEQKIFRIGFTVGYKRGTDEGRIRGYEEGASDERAQGRIEALREGLDAWKSVMSGGGAQAKAQPPDFIRTMGFTKGDVEAVYKRQAKTLHPDVVGGSHEQMLQLNKAREAALEELEHGPKGKSTRRRR